MDSKGGKSWAVREVEKKKLNQHLSQRYNGVESTLTKMYRGSKSHQKEKAGAGEIRNDDR